MRDDAAVLLRHAWQKTRHVFKSNQRNVEAVAEANEARAFNRSRNIEHAREKRRLICNDADRASTQVAQSRRRYSAQTSAALRKSNRRQQRIDYVTNVIWLI